MVDVSVAPAPVRLTRALAVGSALALIALGLAWELWLAPTGRGTLALKVLPLVIPLPGLLKHRMYTYRWVSLLTWLYFTEGVVRSTSEHGASAVLAGGEIVLSLVLFAACAMHVRWRLKALRASAQAHVAQRRDAEAKHGAPEA
ncbi:MAG: DUF2069 domain-containing protein [Betaproteobacteria bacterium]|nr:MAG: DUF2069 domain-containing protein [Betaproteobacteria bacterium]